MHQVKILSIAALSLLACSSCEKDEGKLPAISFVTGTDYTSGDATLDKGASFKVGIKAEKTEKEDVLKQFNITRSVDGAAGSSVFTKSLSGSEGDVFTYNYTGTMDTVSGQKNKYTFTITNRDGLVNQVSVTLTVR